MAGTGALRTSDAASSDYDQDSDDRPNFGRGAFIPDSANRMGLMAWFAEAAYRRDVVDSIPVRPQYACRYLQGAPAPTADMPPGWSRWVFHQHRAASELPIRSCVDQHGLFFEIYVLGNADVANDYPTIFRVYHTGELLPTVRSFTTSLTSSRFGRYDIGVQFFDKSFVKGHSMQILACGFADIILETQARTDIAAHNYPVSYIQSQVMASRACCQYREQKAQQIGNAETQTNHCEALNWRANPVA